MRVALLTREYPPEVYGGAGVHVEYLGRELAQLVDLEVHCWGAERSDPAVHAYGAWDALAGKAPHRAALQAVSVDLLMAAGVEGADLVHSHTWYAQFAGHLAKLIYGIPHVATVHSLEPMRPWKAEQLGGGYALSSFCEKTALEGADALVAVSQGSKVDILECYPTIDESRVEVIYNGIDTNEYKPDPGTDVLERFGIDPSRPMVVFVGRITRQKGVAHLIRAAADFDPAAQLVLCAGAPDTPEMAAEVATGVDRLKASRDGVFWILDMLDKLGVIRYDDLGDFTVTPHRIVRDTLFRLGFIDTPYASSAAALTATTKAARRAVPAGPADEILATFALAAGCAYDCPHRKLCDFPCRERLE